MSKAYYTTLGFGLLGLIFATIVIDGYRLSVSGANPLDTYHGSALYVMIIVFILAYSARLIAVDRISVAVRKQVRILLTIAMVSVVIATAIGCLLLASGAKLDTFTLAFASLSSLSALLWLLRYNRPVVV